MNKLISALKAKLPAPREDKAKKKPRIDIRCRLGVHDFFDPTSEQPSDAWFMEDIQRFREQYPIQNGHLYCKRCGKEKSRKVGVIFDSLPFMIRF